MSNIKFSCVACGEILDAELSQVGSTLVCSACSTAVKIPPYGVIPGMQIGDFVVERRLGIGGMGEVWLADQPGMQRKVALKILSPELAANASFVERFIQEAKLAGKLTHSNIVAAYHAGEDQNIYYLAISYIDGTSLDELLEAGGVMSEADALNIVRDIALALKYAWDKFKLLHRDIKPSNIMLDEDNVAMLMDMGISKSLEEDISLTLTGIMVGTPAYVSPEQAKAESDIDFRADLYSLGVTLYRMLTGVLPFSGATAMATVSKHLTDKLPDCRELNPKITPGCKRLLETMMAKDKADRYASWNDFIAALDEILAKNSTGINFCCSTCTGALTVDAEFINSKVNCAFCGSELTVPAFGIIPGMKIGDFIIEKRLGAGGMGEVWLAEQPAMHRKAALKFLSPELNDNIEFIKRFSQEARMAGKLIHPNIVTAYHAGEDNGVRYLAISYVNGVELSNLLKVENMMNEQKALKIVQEIAEALNYAWNKFNILHRDVKPGNIMIEHDGTAMLMDLGLSKIVSDDISLTATGVAVGTPAYISPEQAKGEKDIDFRADIYSLGATLFQMMTGQLPFNAITGIEIATKHISEPLPDCQRINPAITDSCKYLIESMMEKHKESRPDTWGELIDNVNKVAIGKKILTTKRQNNIFLFIICSSAVAIILLGMAIMGLISQDSSELRGNEIDNRVISEPKPKKFADNKTATKPIISEAEKRQAEALKKMTADWSVAEKYLADNQQDFTVNMVKFENIEKLYPRTKYARRATDKIQQLKQEKSRLIAVTIDKLRQKAELETKQHKFTQAIALLRGYNGKWQSETATAREAIIKTVELEQQKYEVTAVKPQVATVTSAVPVIPASLPLTARQQLLNSVAQILLDGKISVAKTVYTKSAVQVELPELSKVFADLESMPVLFKQQLQKEVGKKFALTDNGKTSYAILEKITGRYLRLAIKDGSVTIGKKYPMKNIPFEQKIRYLRKTEMSPVALAVLLTRHYFKQDDTAKTLKTAEQCGILAPAFKAYITAKNSTVSNKKAEIALSNMVKSMGVKQIPFTQATLTNEFKTLKLTVDKAKQLAKELQQLRESYATTDYLFVNQKILNMLENYLSTQTQTEADQFFDEIKRKLGTDDTVTKKLVPLIIGYKTDLQKNVAAGKPIHLLAPQLHRKIVYIIPPGKMRVFGLYLNELRKKYGYNSVSR